MPVFVWADIRQHWSALGEPIQTRIILTDSLFVRKRSHAQFKSTAFQLGS